MQEDTRQPPPLIMKHPIIRRLEALSRNRAKVRSMRERLERHEGPDALAERLVENGACSPETAARLVGTWGQQPGALETVWARLGEAAAWIERYDLPLDMWWAQVPGAGFEIDVKRTAGAVRVVLWTEPIPEGSLLAKLAHDPGYFDEIDALARDLDAFRERIRAAAR
jgi:hypothetical protein